MNDPKSNLGVQSYCFRNFKETSQVIDLLKTIGLTRIELWRGHADFNDPSKFDGIIEQYRKAGVQIASIGVQGFKGDAANEEKWFDFAKRAGAKMISADFGIGTVPESFGVAEKLADKYDVNIGIHNHGGRHWLGSSSVLADVFGKTGKRIGLCLDTAWSLDSGENPVAVAEKFIDRLYGVHIKDFVFDRARKPEDVVVGTGNLDLKAIVGLIREKAPEGCCTILEYEGDASAPAPALIKCVQAVRAV